MVCVYAVLRRLAVCSQDRRSAFQMCKLAINLAWLAISGWSGLLKDDNHSFVRVHSYHNGWRWASDEGLMFFSGKFVDYDEVPWDEI